jgi:integrase
MPKLTKSFIEKLELPAAGKQKIYWDSEQGGLGLRVTSGSKSFVFQQRVNGKSPRTTIGAWPDMSSDDARERARKLAVLVDDGINPVQQAKKVSETSVTLDTVYKLFISQRQLKARTRFDYSYYVKAYFSDWNFKPLAIIDADMVMARYRKIIDASGAAQASVALRFLRSLINFARATYGSSVFSDNPVSSLTAKKAWVRSSPRTDHLKLHEIKKFIERIRQLDNKIMAGYLEFILMTGARRTEAATLKWRDVDLKSLTLTFIDTKNNTNRVVPITNGLLNILTTLSALRMGDYVFATVGKDGSETYINSPFKAMNKVNQLAGSKVTVHGLRRTYATVLESLDCPSYPLKTLLGHSMKGDVTTNHYTQISVERVRPWAVRYDSFITKLMIEEEAVYGY